MQKGNVAVQDAPVVAAEISVKTQAMPHFSVVIAFRRVANENEFLIVPSWDGMRPPAGGQDVARWIEQVRQGAPAFKFPEGMCSPDETKFDTAVRVFGEQTGLTLRACSNNNESVRWRHAHVGRRKGQERPQICEKHFFLTGENQNTGEDGGENWTGELRSELSSKRNSNKKEMLVLGIPIWVPGSKLRPLLAPDLREAFDDIERYIRRLNQPPVESLEPKSEPVVLKSATSLRPEPQMQPVLVPVIHAPAVVTAVNNGSRSRRPHCLACWTGTPKTLPAKPRTW